MPITKATALKYIPGKVEEEDEETNTKKVTRPATVKVSLTSLMLLLLTVYLVSVIQRNYSK